MRTIIATAFLLIELLVSQALAENPKVVASIAPVHSLVSAVMQGIGEPYLLVRGASSPHTYSLRPSDARSLVDANLIFWVGEDLEIFLATPLQTLAVNALIIPFSKVPALVLLPANRSLVPKSTIAEPNSFAETDMHIWLDPGNAAVMLGEIERALSGLDPENAQLYSTNAQRARLALDELTVEINTMLAPVRGEKFIFYHDAYRYFERAFSLEAAAIIIANPENRPGARTIADMRSLIEQQGATCIFSEPQFASNISDMLIGDTDAKSGVLDPLGADIEPGPDLYFQLLRNMAESITACLER